MTFYELLLFVHVLAAAAWFGAAALSLVLVELMARARDTAGVLKLGSYDERVAQLLFIPASLVVLGVGFWLVVEGPWSFGRDGWVGAGLGLLVATFVLGVGFIVPAGKKLEELGKSSAPEPEIEAQVAVLRRLSYLDISLIAAAIFVMTVKPF